MFHDKEIDALRQNTYWISFYKIFISKIPDLKKNELKKGQYIYEAYLYICHFIIIIEAGKQNKREKYTLPICGERE